MAIEHLNQLAKLRIDAYGDVGRNEPFGEVPEFTVMFNPASFSMRYSVSYSAQRGLNSEGGEARFAYSPPNELSVKLVMDGTGVGFAGLGPEPDSVPAQIDRFLKACFHKNGDKHEPNYLRVSWGRGPLQAGFDCRLKTVDITYTSFDRDGSVLRAELDVTFVQDVDATKQAAAERLSSPDVSHVRTVRAGDTLPLLCREIYGSPAHHAWVARINQLDTLRHLEPGTELYFPPLERSSR